MIYRLITLKKQKLCPSLILVVHKYVSYCTTIVYSLKEYSYTLEEPLIYPAIPAGSAFSFDVNAALKIQLAIREGRWSCELFSEFSRNLFQW